MTHLFDSYPDHDRDMFLSAFHTISRLEAWEFLKSYNPSETGGFMFDMNPEIDRIETEISIAFGCNHSGCSMACTMRMMQYIAKNNLYQTSPKA